MTALRWPVSADGFIVEMLHDAIHFTLHMQDAIGDQSQQGIGASDTLNLGIERPQIQPMSRLRDGDQIHAVISQTAVVSQSRAIAHTLLRLRLSNLIGAAIRGNHFLESLGQQHRKLPSPAGTIQRPILCGTQFGQHIRQLLRITGAVTGIVGCNLGKVIFELGVCHRFTFDS